MDIDQVKRAAWLVDILRSARSARNCVKDYMKDRPDKGLMINISGGTGFSSDNFYLDQVQDLLEIIDRQEARILTELAQLGINVSPDDREPRA